MFKRSVVSVSVLVSVVGLLAVTAGSASAAPGDHFTCRASAVRVRGLGVLDVEPTVANSADDPCARDHAQTASVLVASLLSSGIASATTTSASGGGAAAGQLATVSVPLLGLTADAATAAASYACTDGAPSPTGGSRVVNLSLGGGAPVTTSAPATQTVNLSVGGVATVQLNRTITTPASIIQRAVDITILGGPDSGAEIVLGEASADVAGNPCQIGTTGLTPPNIHSEPSPASSSPSATFTFISNTPGATLQCSLDNAAYTPCNATTTFTNLRVGTHTLRVREILDGVIGPVSTFTFTVAAPANTSRPRIFGSARAGRKLTCTTGHFNHQPTRFSYSWSRDRTPIAGANRSTYKVQTSDEGLHLTCTVIAYNPAGASRPATSPSVTVAVPYVARCPRATGSLNQQTLGLIRLGMTRTQARRAFTRSSDRGKRFEDFFCLTPIGVRVGYASTVLLKTLSHHEQTRVAGRVVLALTSNAFYAAQGVRPGATLAAAQHRLGKGHLFHVGLNDWDLVHHHSWTSVLKIRHRIVEEIGIADPRITHSQNAQRRFIKSFS